MNQALLRGINYLLCLFIIVFFSACESSKYHAESEGVIEYNITYPEKMEDKLLASMLPSKAIMKFKNNMTATEIKVGMGIMTTSFITDPAKKTLTALLQISDKKYALVLDSIEVKKHMGKIPLKIQLVDETKKIAGFNCKKAIVTDSNNTSYSVYYTNEIKINNSTWNTPLYTIDGVLLEYPIIQNNIRMVMTAVSISGEKTDNSTYGIPADYSRVATLKEMPEIFQAYFP